MNAVEHIAQLQRITELRRQLGLPPTFRGKLSPGWSQPYYAKGRLQRWIRWLEREQVQRVTVGQSVPSHQRHDATQAEMVFDA